MSVYIEEIDEQHKKLIEHLNNLFSAMIDGKAQKIINDTVDELIDYADYHFKTEEKYFEVHNYPVAQQHIIQQSFFKDEILQFKKAILDGKSTVPMDVFNFLKDWLTEHIMQSDKKYAKYFSKNNVI